MSRLVFSTSTELIVLPPDAVVCIGADGNYSMIKTAGGDSYTLTLQLGMIEKRIAEMITPDDNRFIRIGKSLIINRDYVVAINVGRQRLVLSDAHTFRYEEMASREALRALKEYIESKYQIIDRHEKD